ncbi:MAG: sulfotransferase domain-containing protein [Pseudomonadota bacterium]
MGAARKIRDAARTYRGSMTEPERWDSFHPRTGDVILVTPAKSGTTWTQSMIAMLLHGTTDLPDKLGVVSPWIDAGIAPHEDNLAALDRQKGRRVIKTHTPPDGWPVWDDVRVVSVFRHPLEVFLSIRKHIQNSKLTDEHPLLDPIDTSLPYYLDRRFSEDEVDRDGLPTIAWFFREVVLSERWTEKLVLNYAGIARDHLGTIRALDAFLDSQASDDLMHQIASATEFGAMKARATDFAPEASQDFWHDDAKFFASGRSGTWHSSFTDAQIELYNRRFAELLPDPAHRAWIETGQGDV